MKKCKNCINYEKLTKELSNDKKQLKIKIDELQEKINWFDEIKYQYDKKNGFLHKDIRILKNQIKYLNSLNRVRSELRKKKIIKFITKEGKATLSELAEHCEIEPGNCSRNCVILIKEGKIKKVRRGLFKLINGEEYGKSYTIK